MAKQRKTIWTFTIISAQWLGFHSIVFCYLLQYYRIECILVLLYRAIYDIIIIIMSLHRVWTLSSLQTWNTSRRKWHLNSVLWRECFSHRLAGELFVWNIYMCYEFIDYIVYYPWTVYCEHLGTSMYHVTGGGANLFCSGCQDKIIFLISHHE